MNQQNSEDNLSNQNKTDSCIQQEEFYEIVVVFHGNEHASYINRELGIVFQNFQVSDSELTDYAIQDIIAQLNNNQNGIRFTDSMDSVSADNLRIIYIGETHVFDLLGPRLQGISEISGNVCTNSPDSTSAFVLTQNIKDSAELIKTILHEAGHLTGTLSHDTNRNGLDLNDFMAVKTDGMVLTEDTNIVNCIFSENTAGTNGAAIYCNGTYAYTITGSTFTGNRASTSSGGSIYNRKGIAEISYSIFDNNFASTNGGAIYNNGGTMSVFRSSFSDNTASNNRDSYGGAVYASGDIGFSQVLFDNNSASEGGAVYASLLKITGSTFSRNIASIGGAIRTKNSATVNQTLFENNTASTGGAIFHANSTLSVNNFFFYGNDAQYGGAIINNDDAIIILTGNTFRNNQASMKGGALYNRGTASLADCLFEKESDTLFNAESSLLQLSGKNRIGADITNNGTITSANNGATLCFINTSCVTFSGTGTLVRNIDLEFQGKDTVFFVDGFDFSKVDHISINCVISPNTTFTVFSVSNMLEYVLTGKIITINGDSGEYGQQIANYNALYQNNLFTIEILPTPIVSTSGSIENVTIHSVPYYGSGYTSIPEAFSVADVIAVTGCTIHDRNTVASGKKLAVTDTEFSSSSSGTYGGAIYNNGKLDLQYVLFEDNTATQGGAIYNNDTAGFAGYINNSTFTGHSASQGGCIYTRAILNLEKCTFADNTGRQRAAGVAFMDHAGGTSSVIECLFANNNAASGSAIFLTGTDLVIQGSTFSGNISTGSGKCGTLLIQSCDLLSISETVFSFNTANGTGGAIYISDPQLVIEKSTFFGNTASTGGAIFIAGNSSSSYVTIKDSDFITLTDTIYNQNANVSFSMKGAITIGADIYSASPINCSEADFAFVQSEDITISAECLSCHSIMFDGTGSVIFTEQQDFSETEIYITASNTATTVLAVGDFIFNPNQLFTVNGYSATLGETNALGYLVDYDSETTHQLTLSHISDVLPRNYEGKIDGAVLIERLESNSTTVIDFGTDSSSTDSADLGTNILTANCDKYVTGGGASVTNITANLCGNGNHITIEGLTWNGYVLGNAISSLSDSGGILIQGDSSISYACGGGYLTTPDGLYLETNTILTVAPNASGSSMLLCAGSYVGANTIETGETHLSIKEDTNYSNTDGFVMGRSLVSSDADYTFFGDSYVDIASGYFERVYGAGVIQSEDASYTHNGNIYIKMTGGTVGKALFGGIGANYAAYGTKTINGSINITIDSSENAIELYTVFGGCNGPGTITQDVTITFTGLGSNLTFKPGQSGVLGDNATNEQHLIEGTRRLVFDSFSGNFGAKVVKKFDDILFTKNSFVILQAYDLSQIHTWNFDVENSLKCTDLHNNDFRGDILNFGHENDSLTVEEYLFLEGDVPDILNGFDELGGVNLFGIAAIYDEDEECWATSEYKLEAVSDDENSTYYLQISKNI